VIAFVRGNIAELEPTHVVIDCQGVGYMVRISLNTYQHLQGKKDTKLYTHHQVREDAQILYGFFEQSEQHLFELLISVSGVGGSTGLAILSSSTPQDLLQAIANEDTAALKRIKGIGAKTAGRIVLELKDKMDVKSMPAGSPSGAAAAPVSSRKQEAMIALMNLGFSRAEVSKRIDQITKKHGADLSVEEVIKLALRNG